jgi:hypothetical protein
VRKGGKSPCFPKLKELNDQRLVYAFADESEHWKRRKAKANPLLFDRKLRPTVRSSV